MATAVASAAQNPVDENGLCAAKKLSVIRSRRGGAAAAGPVRMEEFAAWFVDALIGVGAKIVALRL